ncbi:MAG: DUF1566 domain-containing protein [Myxococcaceae bacterium]|nr:DUF1566 domain-containing protein [Myxococcaceae bacterium]MBH2006651.1 DUF1566 domain-containing protein [Myxococcaceae bacterium]
MRPNNVARTLPIRINLLSDLGGWNTDLQELEVPELEWELNRGDSETMTFEQAEAYAADRSADGWRLPTLWELEALYRQSEVLNRDLSDDFNNEYLLVNAFWSSTEVEGRSTHIWHIDFGLGLNDEERVDHSFHELELRVRLVRSREA